MKEIRFENNSSKQNLFWFLTCVNLEASIVYFSDSKGISKENDYSQHVPIQGNVSLNKAAFLTSFFKIQDKQL